jgi:hypothetical protein
MFRRAVINSQFPGTSMIYCSNFESFLFSSELIFGVFSWCSHILDMIFPYKLFVSIECPKAVFFIVRKIRHQKIVLLKRFVIVSHGIAVLVPRTHSNSVSLHYFGIVLLLL